MEELKNVEEYREELVKAVQDSIRIKSVEEKPFGNMPFGVGPYKALEHILKLGKEMGFETKNLDGYAGYIEFGQGEESLGILGHVDVVPEGEGWTYAPYEAEIHDGKIYGRGTTDDKGPTIAALYAMKVLKDSGIRLNKKVRMIVGANEETDWKCMDYYFKHEEAPEIAFTPDATFPVIYAEKGSMTINLVEKIEDDILVEIEAGVASNVVVEKARVVLRPKNIEENLKILEEFKSEYDVEYSNDKNQLEIRVRGKSAHGSMPELGISGLHILMKILGNMDLGQGEFSKFVDLYNEKIGFYHHGEKIGCFMEDDIVGKLTFNPGLIKYENARLILTVDIRYPVEGSSLEVVRGIEENLKASNLKLEVVTDTMKPLHVDKNSFLVKKLMKVYRDFTGEDIEATTIGGTTYAKAMENAVAFGPMFPGMEDLAHQKDEHISIDHLMDLLEIYVNAIYELAK